MSEAFPKSESLQDCLMELCEEYCDLLPNDIPVLEKAPEALDFYRTYLSPNIPFVIKNGVKHWPALSKWSNNYLRSQLLDKMCTVAVTPNGYADAVVDDIFMLPEERTLPFSSFLNEMENPHPSRVFYLQKQNNCLLDEFTSLVHDVDFHIPWATEAIGDFPEAANFWMGDRRAITSLHKDHYENIYCVIRGTKEFILHPPVAAAWMPYESFRKGMYYFEDDDFKIMDMDDEVKWIPIDPFAIDYKKYPLSLKTKAYQCILNEGDVLYLPSLWFHYVRQSHACIAVNYWYEMSYDVKYSYFYFLEKLKKLSLKN